MKYDKPCIERQIELEGEMKKKPKKKPGRGSR